MFCNSCQLSHKPQVYLPHPFSGNEAMHSNTYTPTQYISHISVLQVLCTQCTQEFEFCCITYLQNPLIQIWYGLLHFDFCICFFFFLKINSFQHTKQNTRRRTDDVGTAVLLVVLRRITLKPRTCSHSWFYQDRIGRAFFFFLDGSVLTDAGEQTVI